MTLAKPLGAPGQPQRFEGLSAADQCVHCGLCLPHCPTYAWHAVEGDSPRGRLTLMQGLAQGHLEPESPRLREHLEGCLGCRSCEAVCPARVPFAALMDRARAILVDHPATHSPGERLRHAAQHQAMKHPLLRDIGGLAARGAVRLRAQRLLPQGPWRRSVEHVGASLARAPHLRGTVTPETADVLLFTGCMDRFFTGPDLEAALRVLDRLGFGVAIPPGQTCCGALARHAGHTGEAQELEARNLAAFAHPERPVIVLDSGCEASLREYPEGGPGSRVSSLTRFLLRYLRATPDAAPWLDRPVRVALHLPCTLRNVTREGRELPELLARLPGVTLVSVSAAPNCCGAGGTAMLTQPRMADDLGRATLAALRADQPDIIVSANVGCSVHLRALVEEGIPILSPARFLAGRLARP